MILEPCLVMCTTPDKPGSLNTFQKLEDGTECTIKNPNGASGLCKGGKCL